MISPIFSSTDLFTNPITVSADNISNLQDQYNSLSDKYDRTRRIKNYLIVSLIITVIYSLSVTAFVLVHYYLRNLDKKKNKLAMDSSIEEKEKKMSEEITEIVQRNEAAFVDLNAKFKRDLELSKESLINLLKEGANKLLKL